jgi:hypothetical protein
LSPAISGSPTHQQQQTSDLNVQSLIRPKPIQAGFTTLPFNYPENTASFLPTSDSAEGKPQQKPAGNTANTRPVLPVVIDGQRKRLIVNLNTISFPSHHVSYLSSFQVWSFLETRRHCLEISVVVWEVWEILVKIVRTLDWKRWQ